MREKLPPQRELIFAGKMGFLSKPLWNEFFASKSRAQNARNWNKLLSEEYFRPHDSKMLINVLVLGPRGIRELKQQGIVAVTKPHLGQFDHDVKVSKIILGLEKEHFLDKYITEGELKKKFYVGNKSSRESISSKFPDLTLEFERPSRFKRVAIEVEQSLKSLKRYEQLMNSYANQNRVDVVVFVSDRQTIFNRISRAMKATNYPSWDRPVGFSEMNEWLKNPATAPIYLSRCVSSIRQWTTDAK